MISTSTNASMQQHQAIDQPMNYVKNQLNRLEQAPDGGKETWSDDEQAKDLANACVGGGGAHCGENAGSPQRKLL